MQECNICSFYCYKVATGKNLSALKTNFAVFSMVFVHKDSSLLTKSVTIQKEQKNASNRDQSKEILKMQTSSHAFLGKFRSMVA